MVRRLLAGGLMWAGGRLVDLAARQDVVLSMVPADPTLGRAFSIAGRGRIPPEVLSAISQHPSSVYLELRGPLSDRIAQVDRLTRALARCGGLAIKVENAGTAFAWEPWFELLHGSPYDLHRLAVALVAVGDQYVSSGMSAFGLPDCQVPASLDVNTAADLITRFNVWQIAERPVLASGHTFSLAADAPVFRLTLRPDEGDEPWTNPHGVWRLTPA
jgi:hypothetical protein